MAQPGKLAYIVIYVEDVPKAVEFYEKALGLNVRSAEANSDRWAELHTGQTTIAFTITKQRETAITGGVAEATHDRPRDNLELYLNYKDVDAAFKHAVSLGATSVAEPEDKSWGQKVGYIRDINGVTIRMGSEL